MRAFVVTTRFAKTPDGRLFNANGILGYNFWTRYHDAYEEVVLVGEAEPVEAPPDDWFEATGPGVSSWPVPSIRGPGQLVMHAWPLIRSLRALLAERGALHLRAPNPLANFVMLIAGRHRPYGLEVVGDPWDSLAPGAFTGPLRAIYRRWFLQSLRAQCRKADAVAYVTEAALQKRYPPGPHAYATYFSSIDLNDEAFAKSAWEPSGRQSVRLATVATLEQLYKAPHVLIDAVARRVQAGDDIELTIVGDGKHRADLESRVARLGVGDRVCFRGRLTAGEDVRSVLDEADLFVLPSFQEGLPKAMIEAMARGLPCIGSTAGGIPELLETRDLVEPGSTSDLATRIGEVIASTDRMQAMGARNLRRAREYHIDVLRARRRRFYEYVRRGSQRWWDAPD